LNGISLTVLKIKRDIDRKIGSCIQAKITHFHDPMRNGKNNDLYVITSLVIALVSILFDLAGDPSLYINNTS